MALISNSKIKRNKEKQDPLTFGRYLKIERERLRIDGMEVVRLQQKQQRQKEFVHPKIRFYGFLKSLFVLKNVYSGERFK